jgi:hypothetical protein
MTWPVAPRVSLPFGVCADPCSPRRRQSDPSSRRLVFAPSTSDVRNSRCTGPFLSFALSLGPLTQIVVLVVNSIRETAGTQDMSYLIDLFSTFFDRFGEVDDLTVD